MRKTPRPLAWLLALLLAAGTLPLRALAAEAAEGGSGAARDTGFFTPGPHTELNYRDIEYKTIDIAPLLAEAEALRSLAQDAANAEELEKRFLALEEAGAELSAMAVIVQNRVYADSEDEWAAEEQVRVQADLLLLDDTMSILLRDVLRSPCGEVLRSKMDEAAVYEALDYEDRSEEQFSLEAQDTILQNTYRSILAKPTTVTVDGTEYTEESMMEAYGNGALDSAAFAAVYRALARAKNAELGEIYLEMVRVRNRIGVLNGYDNYIGYAYEKLYHRDYSPDEAAAFCELVKEEIVPRAAALDLLREDVDEERLPEDVSYDGEGMFDTLEPFFAQLSDELAESMDYIRSHGAYDLNPAPNKTGTAYSIMIPYYNMPFYFANADGGYSDLLTSIHEMGHNNRAYWVPEDWKSGYLCIDTAEVHSQALELLMLRYYPELFGSQADAIALDRTYDLLSSVTDGCLYDELQRWVYAEPELTLQKINAKYRELAGEYALVSEDDERTEMYGWYMVPHNFLSPFYYISYATSAAGAFAFWEESLEGDYFAAVDHYLRFCALPNSAGFEDSFAEAGLPSPLSAEYVKSLGLAIHDKLLPIKPYTDVYADDPWGLAVIFVDMYALIDGVSADRFEPAGRITRGECMTAMERINAGQEDGVTPLSVEDGIAAAAEDGISDGSFPDAALTQEQAVVMLYRLITLDGSVYEPDEPELLDQIEGGGAVSGWAREAMTCALELGLLDADSLAPQATVTRAELAELLLRAYLYAAAQYDAE